MHMLGGRGIKVTNGQLARFLHFVQKCCPWFPEEGSVNLQTWNKVGNQLREYYTQNGPEKVPVNAFALWNLIKEVLEPQQEAEKRLQRKSFLAENSPEEEPLLLSVAKPLSRRMVMN